MDMKGSDFVGAGILCIIIGIIIILLYGDYKRIPNAKKTEGNVCSVEWDKELDEGKSFSMPTFSILLKVKNIILKQKTKKDMGIEMEKRLL